jgi:hypothetical protein
VPVEIADTLTSTGGLAAAVIQAPAVTALSAGADAARDLEPRRTGLLQASGPWHCWMITPGAVRPVQLVKDKRSPVKDKRSPVKDKRSGHRNRTSR